MCYIHSRIEVFMYVIYLDFRFYLYVYLSHCNKAMVIFNSIFLACIFREFQEMDFFFRCFIAVRDTYFLNSYLCKRICILYRERERGRACVIHVLTTTSVTIDFVALHSTLSLHFSSYMFCVFVLAK